MAAILKIGQQIENDMYSFFAPLGLQLGQVISFYHFQGKTSSKKREMSVFAFLNTHHIFTHF